MGLLIPAVKIFDLRTAWMETLALTFLFPLVGYLIDASDPFYLNTQFPWLILSPILISLRYGFLFGMIGIVLLIALFFLCWVSNWVIFPFVPVEMLVGMILTALITAEFHDIWRRKMQPLHYKYQNLQLRMYELSRAYYLLKESHALLEQQAATTKSMRAWLLELQNRLLSLEKRQGGPLDEIGDQILELFSEYGSIQTASVHSVSESRRINPQPGACLGNPAAVSATHPLVLGALKTGHVASLQRDSEARDQDYDILVVVPLVDIFNKIWGLVVINEMPMFALQENTLDLFALLGGYLGDLIQRRGEEQSMNEFVSREFEHELKRAWKDVRSLKMSTAVALCIFSQKESDGLAVSKFRSQVRGLDKVWSFRDSIGRLIVVCLLPFMDQQDMSDFFNRLHLLESDDRNSWLGYEEEGGRIILNEGIIIYSWVLNEKTLSVNPILSKVVEFCPGKKTTSKSVDTLRADISF